MYKIDQIASLVENIQVEQPKEMPKELIDFAKSFAKIEKEFQKIDIKYKLEILPTKDSNDEPLIYFSLIHDNKQLFKYWSSESFYKYKEYKNYEPNDFQYSLSKFEDCHLEKVANFKQDTQLYNQVVESHLIGIFLENEKAVRNVAEARKALKTKI